MKNIIVLFGGESVERDVSIITGLLTLNSIDKEKFNPIPIYISSSGEWFTGDSLFDIETYKELDETKLTKVTLLFGENKLYVVKGRRIKELLTISCAINCCHGGDGENGSLIGALSLHKIPFVSPSVMPSAVAMDKEITKFILRGMGVKVLPCKMVKDILELDKLKVQFPAVIKPAKLGSSVGIKVAENIGELESAVANALRYDDKAIIEPRLSGFTEINCACYRCSTGLKVSECEKPIGKTEILSFEDKYKAGKRQFPARISESLSNKIKKMTCKIYQRLGFSGVIRIDYFVDSKGEVYLNEINSVPGSMAYYLFCQNLSEFSVMLTEMIIQAEKEYSEKSTLIKKLSTSLLSIKGAKGSKHL